MDIYIYTHIKHIDIIHMANASRFLEVCIYDLFRWSVSVINHHDKAPVDTGMGDWLWYALVTLRHSR